ncbi:MAG: hypothetical protein Q8M07_24030 [Prosthecobacter sp.]|nr:hypothetical protein [Prosthecobacter sp.]
MSDPWFQRQLTLHHSSFRIRHSSFSPPVIANLELMPLRLNIGKGDRITDRQRALTQRLRGAGLF